MSFRRLNSFMRMDNIMDQVDHWFFSSEDLARKMNYFANRHVRDFLELDEDEYAPEVDEKGRKGTYLFSPDDPDERRENNRRRGHPRREVNMKFQELFEIELEDFIKSKRVGLEQFQEVFQMSQEEEVRDGQRFFRWIDAADYHVFLKMMQLVWLDTYGDVANVANPALAAGDSSSSTTTTTTTTTTTSTSTTSTPHQTQPHHPSGNKPVHYIRKQIEDKMELARLALRRRKQIQPLLDKWDLKDFNLLVKVLQSTDCPSCGKHKTNEERKFMARWRNKLFIQQRESVDKTTPRSVIVDYLSKYAEDYEEDEFLHLVTYLDQYIESLPLNELQKKRRLAWKLFSCMDELFVGSVYYDKLVKFLQRNTDSRFHSKDFKKVCTKYSAKIKVANNERLEIRLEDFQDFIIELLRSEDLAGFQAMVQWFVDKKHDTE
eukprot:TRINITY_DN66045_c9_g1_i1.p1 TRINITY_DN66045_c9_g1~~TRINITY_DN66045_c9_g1_i1.p1  ORF type:complete len:433 (+),score=41.92 TRINITY_DN66045_c9_g1_i1:80-1378(+)